MAPLLHGADLASSTSEDTLHIASMYLSGHCTSVWFHSGWPCLSYQQCICHLRRQIFYDRNIAITIIMVRQLIDHCHWVDIQLAKLEI